MLIGRAEPVWKRSSNKDSGHSRRVKATCLTTVQTQVTFFCLYFSSARHSGHRGIGKERHFKHLATTIHLSLW